MQAVEEVDAAAGAGRRGAEAGSGEVAASAAAAAAAAREASGAVAVAVSGEAAVGGGISCALRDGGRHGRVHMQLTRKQALHAERLITRVVHVRVRHACFPVTWAL